MQDLKVLKKSQKNLLLRIKEDIHLAKGVSSEEIRKYEISFQNNFRVKYRKTTKEALLDRIASSRITLVGDFHTFRQSQKAFLRLLEDLHSRKIPISIGLECLHTGNAATVDHYLKKLISFREMIDELDLQSFWPFSLKTYQSIFEFARSSKTPILPLNMAPKAKTVATLASRDYFSASLIDRFMNNPITKRSGRKLIVLYGELHLSKKKLPLAIHRRANIPFDQIVVVHQNIARLYWKSFRQVYREKEEIFASDARTFCIFNSTPWMKYKSYLDWLESGSTDDSIENEYLEPTDSIIQLFEFLSNSLGLNIKEPEHFKVIGATQLNQQVKLLKRSRLNSTDQLLADFSKKFRRTVFLHGKTIFLTPSYSQNTIAECASLLLRETMCKRNKAEKTEPLEFIEIIYQFFIGFLGSKILNPKRKCNEVADLQNFILHFDEIKKSKIQNSKRRIFIAVVATLSQSKRKIDAHFLHHLKKTEKIEAMRLIGFILANRTFYSFLSGKTTASMVRDFFNLPLDKKENVTLLFKVILKNLRTETNSLPFTIEANGKSKIF